MTTLKDHQNQMVTMLASGTAIPTSAIRLAHAMHDVLAHLNNTNVAPEAHTERRIDATTPGLNDMMLAADIQALKTPKNTIERAMASVQQQQSLESLLKQRDNTIRQLKGRVADLVAKSSAYQSKVVALQDLLAEARGIAETEQAGCRKEDTELPEDGWIEWSGDSDGWPTRDGETLVDTEHRDGRVMRGFCAQACRWTHNGRNSDIVAYRITGETK